MEEMVPIIDENNNVIEIVPRSKMRKERLPHRASYIVLMNSENKIYVEHRTLIKDYCPGMLDACVGGVVQADEDDIILSGKRELAEELGVHCDIEFLGWHKLQSKPDTFTFAGLFFGVYDGDLVLQESEVAGISMLSYEEVISRKDEFTPDSVLALTEVLSRKNLI